jgi:hypothetical protein
MIDRSRYSSRVDPPTRTISSTLDLSILASLRTLRTGSSVFWKVALLMSSNLALVMVDSKSVKKISYRSMFTSKSLTNSGKQGVDLETSLSQT